MKSYIEIRNQITANTTKIAELEAKADKHMKKAELAAAATWGERKEIHASITVAEETEAVKLYTRAEELKSINKILAENEKAAFIAYAEPIIKDIMQKYNGKQYGKKTAEKIREAAHAAGISFYFSGYGNQDTINIYCMNPENGCKAYNAPEVTAYARTADNTQRAEFISEKNTIQDFNSINFSHYYKYTEDPENKREEAQKAYEDFKKLVDLAKQAESKLNALLPSESKHFNVIGYLSPFERV